MHRRTRPIVAVVSLALAASATALAGGGHWQHSKGRPSVTPPPWSHGHCKDGSKPPCKVGHHRHGHDGDGDGKNDRRDREGKGGKGSRHGRG
jgi:hypothetical protein